MLTWILSNDQSGVCIVHYTRDAEEYKQYIVLHEIEDNITSSMCHVPLSPKMESFRTRICLRAVDQYERLLRNHFNKSSKSHRDVKEMKHEIATSTKMTLKNDSIPSGKDVTENTYSTSRQWRKIQRMVECHAALMSAGTSSSSNDQINTNSTDDTRQFPLVRPDITMLEEDISLKFLALNALDLTVPASDILLKNRLKSWFQLAGHRDGLAPAGPGTVWKRRAGGCENTERIVYEELTRDNFINKFVPKYYREVEYKGDAFIELQDLLFGFNDPHVIDLKLGTRTFLESEVSKTNARCDLYEKMIAVDPNAPTDYEHECKAITKLRYMQFREQQSSTQSHGFRIEAMKFPGKPPITNLKRVKDHAQVVETLKLFFDNRRKTCEDVLNRLKEMRSRFEKSVFFQTHEVIGSSIFLIYDDDKMGVWLIDFAKTYKVPDGKRLTHRLPWEQGNHEEGLLFGLDNLISTIEQIHIQ